MEGYQPMKFDFLDEDIMFIRDCNIPDPDAGLESWSRWTHMFDGASDVKGHGIGEIIISLIGFHIPFTAKLCFDYTNNMAEYEACIYGLEANIELRIKILEVYKDSTLVITQVQGECMIRS